VEVYYEWIQKLAHGLQVPTTIFFFNYYVYNGFTIIPQNHNCKDEVINTTTT
jgi:hypothetical protein